MNKFLIGFCAMALSLSAYGDPERAIAKTFAHLACAGSFVNAQDNQQFLVSIAPHTGHSSRLTWIGTDLRGRRFTEMNMIVPTTLSENGDVYEAQARNEESTWTIGWKIKGFLRISSKASPETYKFVLEQTRKKDHKAFVTEVNLNCNYISHQ